MSSARLTPTAIALLALLGTAPLACGPDDETEECPALQPGPWAEEVVEAQVPGCDRNPYSTVAACVRELGVDHLEESVHVRHRGRVVEAGTGLPPLACVGRASFGDIYDPTDGSLLVPEEDLHWFRILEGGHDVEIALASRANRAAIEVGDEVSVRLDREDSFGFLAADLEVRDEGGQLLWWAHLSTENDSVSPTPDCAPVTLGAAVCQTDFTCARVQHHAIEVGGVSLEPGASAVIGDYRYTHGTAGLRLESLCTDSFASWRLMAATFEG